MTKDNQDQRMQELAQQAIEQGKAGLTLKQFKRQMRLVGEVSDVAAGPEEG